MNKSKNKPANRNTKPAARGPSKPAARGPSKPAAREEHRVTTEEGSNRFEVTGELHHIGEAVEVSDRFTKREFVLNVTDNPKYPQFVLFQASGNGVNWLDDYSEGDSVTVHFNLRGRAWDDPKTRETKYFNTLAAWKIEPAAGVSDEGAEYDIPF